MSFFRDRDPARNKTRTCDRQLHYLYYDWSICLFCPPKAIVLVGKTSKLTNHDKDDIVTCSRVLLNVHFNFVSIQVAGGNYKDANFIHIQSSPLLPR